MPNIMASVGRGGVNSRNDSMVVQKLLNSSLKTTAGFRQLAVDGVAGPKTIEAIEMYQRNVLRWNRVDGRVDPGGKTIQALNQSGVGGPTIGQPAPPVGPTPGGNRQGHTPGVIPDNVGNLNLVVTRFKATSQSIIGDLSINGTRICYTLEEAWRDNQKGHSCVGLGTYSAFLRYTSNKTNREWCFQLNDANGRTAIQMHIGNKPSHTEGCILVGQSHSTDFVSNSTQAYQQVQDFVFGAGFTRQQIRKAAPKHGPINFTFADKEPGISGYA
jgi:peptidoglycan hydrolase-like protein with peptidoglycan-binding domain